MPRPGEEEGNDGYYELRDAGVKGRGAFALKNISAGTRILVDNALFTISTKQADSSVSEADLRNAVANLSLAERNQFRNLPARSSNPDDADYQR